MRITVPDYYDAFHCLAGACPHSCCEKWEVVIDQEHACQYAQVSGELGRKLRTALRQDNEGDFCFPLNGGRCPFLDADNLCEIHKQLGEEATSVTCQEHPRFTEDYGSFREITLSASCPAVTELLLGSEESLTFREFETDEPEEEGDEWLEYLLPLREKLMEILTDRTRSLRRRLERFLQLAITAQDCLDREELKELMDLSASEANWKGLALPEGTWAFLGNLEILEPDWKELLAKAESARAEEVPETLLERVVVYFAFRYLLKTVNDGDLLSRAQLCVLAALVVERLASICGLSEAVRRFSCELEHSDENLEAVLEALWRGQLCVLPL